MKTQLSRNSFKAAKRYSGVYQQQGRMITDADWNNMVDVLKGHLAEALKDVVGNGSPRTGALTIDPANLTIVPGDLYVGGLRASLPGTKFDRIPTTDQPDFPGAPEMPDPAIDPYILYADVWERSLTALEDPGLRDAALNGADTTTRTQTMLQVKVCPEGINPERTYGIPQHGNAALSLMLHGDRKAGDPCDPCAGQVDAGEGRIGNYLFRLEVHAVVGTAASPTSITLKWSSENGAEQYVAEDEARMPPGFVVSGRFIYEFFNQTSEKHLGVHLHPDPGFRPQAGILLPGFTLPEGGADFVRRWDGYCILARKGSAWVLVEGSDMGVPLSTTKAQADPGYVSLGSSLTVNLEALEMALTLDNRTFVAGDYWQAPVREARESPDLPVLEDAPPQGIVHHYLRLARVAADGSVELYADDGDRRRHSFPQLTDLEAADVGYETDCASSLFDSTQNNVEKALNRLCELAAEHIWYKASCGERGLFHQFQGTVEEALNKVCSIQAEHVGFTQPCDTGYYQGKTVTTVAEALGLLCTVQAGGGGCKVTVGLGGQFAKLNDALQSLFEPKPKPKPNTCDICLCLLPGEHEFGGKWINQGGQLNLTITGCGAGTVVRLTEELSFINLTSLKLENFTINALDVDSPLSVERRLDVERCLDVDINNLHHVGVAQKDPLIRVSGGHRVRLEENILEAYTTKGLETPQQVFAVDSDIELADLYKFVRRDEFLASAGGEAEMLAKLDLDQRGAYADKILNKLKEVPTTLAEEVAYRHLVETLQLDTVDAQTLLDRLREVRDQAHHATAGRGVIFMDALASVALEDNTIFGSIGFYGPPGELDPKSVQFDKLVNRIRSMPSGASLQAWDNRITRLTVGKGMIDALKEMNPDTEDVELIQGLYRTALFESNIITGFGNQLFFENLTLSSNDFQGLEDPIGWGFGRTVICTGNRVQRTQYTDAEKELKTVGGGKMMTAAANKARAANLPVNSWP